jgi:parvulin-like peptidyl-prolyl isomerase
MRNVAPTLRTRFAFAFVIGVSLASGCRPDGVADVPATPDEAAPSETHADGDLAARVNGAPILLADFQTQAFDTQRFMVEQGLDPNTDEGQQQLLALRRQVLDELIHQTLIDQYAAERAIEIDEAAIDERVRTYIDEAGGEEAFVESLTRTGTTREDVREMERQSLVGQAVLDEIAGALPETAEHRKVRHILCEDRAACESALGRLRAGEAFETVAAEVSKDATTASTGGDLDWLARGMVPSAALEEAVFALPVGELSEVVQTDFGYHILQVQEVDETRPLSESQRYALRERRLLDWLAERRASSQIEIFIPDLAEQG